MFWTIQDVPSYFANHGYPRTIVYSILPMLQFLALKVEYFQMFLMMRLKLKMISFGPTKHQILGLDFVVPIVNMYISKERMTSQSHCLGTKMKPKRTGTL